MKNRKVVLWILVVVLVIAGAVAVQQVWGGSGPIPLQPSGIQEETSTQSTVVPEDTKTDDQSVDEKTGSGTQEDSETDIPTAPDFRLMNLEGKEVQLSDYRGKVVLINFWTTWCKYCKDEMPAIQEIRNEYQDKGVEVLTVNVQEDAAAVKSYLEKNKLDLPVLLDADGAVFSLYGGTGFPSSYFVGRKGTAEVVIPGAVEKEDFVRILEDLLKK